MFQNISWCMPILPKSNSLSFRSFKFSLTQGCRGVGRRGGGAGEKINVVNC